MLAGDGVVLVEVLPPVAPVPEVEAVLLVVAVALGRDAVDVVPVVAGCVVVVGRVVVPLGRVGALGRVVVAGSVVVVVLGRVVVLGWVVVSDTNSALVAVTGVLALLLDPVDADVDPSSSAVS